mgnify:CR=1 FL=1
MLIHVHSQPSSMQALLHVNPVHMAATIALVGQSIHAYSVQRDFSLKAGIAVLAAPQICMLIQTQEFVSNAKLPVRRAVALIVSVAPVVQHIITC